MIPVRPLRLSGQARRSNGMTPDERFRKNERLLKSKEFDRVYKKGLAGRADGIVLYCLPNALERNRLGFSIGSKKVKHAVSRNRMRRLFREAYRKVKGRLKGGFDIVIVVRRDLHKSLTYKSAESTLLKLAKDIGLIA